MVLYEQWNNKTFYTEKRETIKFNEAVDILNILIDHNTRLKDTIIRVDVYKPFTENRVYIRTTGRINFHFKFTYKQFKKIEEKLIELNHGEELTIVY